MPRGAEGLGAVLDDVGPGPVRRVQHGAEAGKLAEEMYRDHALHPFALDQLGHLVLAGLEVVLPHVHEHGDAPGQDDGRGRGHEGQGRHGHTVAGGQAGRDKGQDQGVGARAHGRAAAGGHEPGDPLLEFHDFSRLQHPAVGEDLLHGGHVVVPVGRELAVQAHEGDGLAHVSNTLMLLMLVNSRTPSSAISRP